MITTWLVDESIESESKAKYQAIKSTLPIMIGWILWGISLYFYLSRN